ncbi:ABC transporter substrate-binding protein [Neobacillus massiliamazoniensis]|uniref:Lipoprotein n=1 Tax=Neobacillus massiliamazoniensis TaxID=1499688 RepID=A0A0U1NRA6_9BACI|nr:ABC transporter substrate-binding protein [Neobacillus massiliamazoniensis]CRK80272.1 lipoprotein [Neobacillus massiliamazoniensis]
MQKGKKTKRILFTIITIFFIFITSACSNNTNGQASVKNSNNNNASKPVELTFYYPLAQIPADVSTVEAEINKITKGKINATVHLKPQTFSDYTQKMNVVLASGGDADIIWTSNWNFDYVTNQAKGAFLPLDDLIKKYAPEVKNTLPQYVMDATKINGKMYAIPNYQIETQKVGFYIQKRFADKYHFDPSSIKTIKDIEPLLASIKQGESKEVVPLAMSSIGNWDHLLLAYNLEKIQDKLLVINYNDPTKILNMYETPEFEQYLEMVRDWYKKGYINQDAATIKNVNDLLKTGNVAVQIHNVLKPGAEIAQKNANGGQDIIQAAVTKPHVLTNSIITTMLAINQKSHNPEAAMKFINLLNTDKQLYNLICYGVEGKNYTKISDNMIKINPDAGYNPNANWVFGNTFNSFLKEGEDPKVNEQTLEMNKTAIPSPILGFKFVAEPVTAEIANLQTVIDQYLPGLVTGTVDPKSKLKEFRDKLKEAGIDKVVAEGQKQLDKFLRK